MKYIEGQVVMLKPEEWYNLKADENGEVIEDNIIFDVSMVHLLGTHVTITDVCEAYNSYLIKEFKRPIPAFCIDDKESEKLLEIQRAKQNDALSAWRSNKSVSPNQNKVEPEKTPKKRGRKPKSQAVTPEIPKGLKRLTKNAKCIGFLDTTGFIVGRYLGKGEDDRYLIDVGYTNPISVKKCRLYDPNVLIELSEQILQSTDSTAKVVSETYDKLKSICDQVESEYGIKLKLTLELVES